MPLNFAFRWNWDYKNNKALAFDFGAARTLLKEAIKDFRGAGLKSEIDGGIARVISAPHKTPGGDSRLHMTVHCKGMLSTYHVYISKNGNFSGITQESVSGMKVTPGHVNNDNKAPIVANSAAL